MKRYGKKVAQQCRYYELENIYEYMVSSYLNGNRSQFNKLYKELCTDAKKDFVSYLFDEVTPMEWEDIIRAAI